MDTMTYHKAAVWLFTFFFSLYIERHMIMKQKQKLSIQFNKNKIKTKIMINRVG